MGEIMRITLTLGAIYLFIIAMVALVVLVSHPAPAVAVIGAASTALSLISLGVGPALVVATLAALGFILMCGLVLYVPRRLNQAHWLASMEEVSLPGTTD